LRILAPWLLLGGCHSPAPSTEPTREAPPIDAPPIDAPLDAPPIDAPADAAWAINPFKGDNHDHKEFHDHVVRLPDVTVTLGSLVELPDPFARVIRARAGLYRACYQHALARDPGLKSGLTLAVQLRIVADGTVTNTTKLTTGSTMKNVAIESCIADNLKRLRFPPSQDPATAVVVPFTFDHGTPPR
jgi:hypothetical protein